MKLSHLCTLSKPALLPASFYVQDERYAAGAWTRRSGYVQDERYAAGAWTRRSGYVTQTGVAL